MSDSGRPFGAKVKPGGEAHGLQDTVDRFQLLLDSAAEGIYAQGPDGVCTFCNRACLRLLGYSHPAELLGSPIHSKIHYARADGDTYPESECPILHAWKHEAGIHVDSEVFWRKGGDSFPAEYWAYPIRRGAEVLGTVVTFLDITERQEAERALQTLSRAIEQTADSVFITDRRGLITYVNPSFETLTGFTAAEAIGSSPNLFKSGIHDARFYEKLWGMISSGEVFRFVVTNRRKDGRLFDEDQTITPIRDAAGTITHFVSTGRDITQRKRTEEALRRLNNQLEIEAARIAGVLHDEAGQFLSSAHMALADVARDAAPALRDRLQQVRQHLDQVEAQLRRVSHELHPSILDDLGLLEAIRFVADTFSRRTGIRVTVDAHVAAPLPATVGTVMYRFVQEALTNMGKHSLATAGSILLHGDDSLVQCTIRDNGAGFDAAATLAWAGKRGLGLKLIRDRLEAVGGTLQIVSTPGQGTELRTTVPVEV